MRELVACLIVATAGCKFGEHIAEAPVDGSTVVDGVNIDAGDTTPDAPDGPGACAPGADGDGDDIPDCTELEDGDPFTDPAKFNGLHAIIGRAPELSGSCSWLDTWDEVLHEFETTKREQDVHAGWSFDSTANRYDDLSYGFLPNWTAAEDGRFQLRFHGQVNLAVGDHCFAIDLGDTGGNKCAQIYLGIGGPATAALAETGFEATANQATGCVTVTTAGAFPIDVVFRNFHLALPPLFPPHNVLDVRHCAGVGCMPTATIKATMLQPQP